MMNRIYTLLSWIDKEKLDIEHLCKNQSEAAIQYIMEQYGTENLTPRCWAHLSANPYAVPLLEKNKDKINPHYLSRNPAAYFLIEEILQERQSWDFIWNFFLMNIELDWYELSANPCAITFLEENPDKIDWQQLCKNPDGLAIIFQNTDKIFSSWLATNPNAIFYIEQNIEAMRSEDISSNENAVSLLLKYPHKINWSVLSGNKNATGILAQNRDKIDWSLLSTNQSELAMNIMELYIDEKGPYNIRYWKSLSRNPYAIPILQRYQQYISWQMLSENPQIFVSNMRKR